MKVRRLISSKKEIRQITGRLAVVTLVFSVLFLGVGYVWAGSDDLFEFVEFKESAMSDNQLRIMSLNRMAPTTMKTNIVRVRMDLSSQVEKVNFNLFHDVKVPLRTTRVEQRAPGDYSWFGLDKDSREYAIIVVKRGTMVGSVRSGGLLYKISPLDKDLHIITQVDERAYPGEHPPEYQELENESQRSLKDVQPLEMKGDGSIITVLVAYTPMARVQAGNIEALIQLAVDETNESYRKSFINTRLQLVYTYQVNYTESGKMTLDRDRFRINGDRYMDEVHKYRDKYAADIAILVTGSGQYCGIASAIMANKATAFAVVAQNCATGYYSFGHEIGHLLGARHNPEADPTDNPFRYGHGFYYSLGHWRTVMSYNCPGGCKRRDYWSNPDVTLNGVPMGTVERHNNARVLNETVARVANFRHSSPDRLASNVEVSGNKSGKRGRTSRSSKDFKK